MNIEHPFDTLELTSFVTDDVSLEKETLIKEHLQECETCRTFVDTLKNEQASFLRELPFDEGAFNEKASETTLSEDRKETSFFTFHKVVAVAALLVFATILSLYLPQPITTTEEPVAGNTLKGEDAFSLYVLEANGEIRQRDDETYYPGERIQVSYSSTAKEYLMLFSFDTSGTVSKFFPAYGDSSITIEIGGDIPLPNSIRLDNYVGEERYLLVLSKSALCANDFEKEIQKEYKKHGFEKFQLPKRAGRVVLEKVTTKRRADEQ